MATHPKTFRAVGLNHVSIPADDLDASERFYRDVFGMEPIAAPNFGFPVRWLRLGDLQLHLQTVDAGQQRITYQHFGIEVDDFVAAYRTLHGMGAFERESRYADLWLLPGGEIQMFVRDPSRNLIEIDCPDVSTVDRGAFDGHLRVLKEEEAQSEQNLRATLFLARRRGE